MRVLKLYSGTKNASSWAMRAWLALRESGIEFEEEVVDIRRPQRFANLREIGAFSPQATVPALVVDDAVIFDSLAIMEYASERGGGALMPSDPIRRAQVRSVVAWQHCGLSRICARLSFESAFYPYKRPPTAGEITECKRLFDVLEGILSGAGGPYLYGRLSLADLSLTPTVVRLVAHDFDLASWPLAQDWTRTLLTRVSVRQWLLEAKSLPPVWLNDYLPPEMSGELHPCSGRLYRV